MARVVSTASCAAAPGTRMRPLAGQQLETEATRVPLGRATGFDLREVRANKRGNKRKE